MIEQWLNAEYARFQSMAGDTTLSTKPVQELLTAQQMSNEALHSHISDMHTQMLSHLDSQNSRPKRKTVLRGPDGLIQQIVED